MTIGTDQLPLMFNQTDYVSVAWSARALGISKRTVLNMLESGQLVGHQLCDRGWWRIRKDSVIAYMAKIREQEAQT